MGAAIVGLELAAVLVAMLGFGWPVLFVGVPLLVITLVALAVVKVWEMLGQRRLEQRRATHWDQSAAVPGGLMSGFFAVSAIPEQPPLPPVDLPPFLRTARQWASRTARDVTRDLGTRRTVGARSEARRPAPAPRPTPYPRPAAGARPARRMRVLSDRFSRIRR